MADPNKYEYQVTMSCGGCAKTVEKALKELEGRATVSTDDLWSFADIQF